MKFWDTQFVFALCLAQCFRLYSAKLSNREDQLVSELIQRHSDIVVADEQELDLDEFSSERAVHPGSEIHLNEALPWLDREEPWYQDHYNELTKDLVELGGSGSNSVMSIFGQKAFPVTLNKNGDVTVAAAEYGQGRAVVTSRYEWLLRENTDSMAQFVNNSVQWVSRNKTDPKIACRDKYKLWGFDDTISNTDPSALKDSDIDIYCFVARHSFTEEEVQQVLEFVENGGGIITGGQLWSWGGNDGDYRGRGNLITMQMGIMIGYFDWGRQAYTVADTPVPERNLYNALTTLMTDPENAVAMNTLSRTGSYAISKNNIGDPAFQEILDLALEVYNNVTEPVVFCKLAIQLTPIFLALDPLDESLLRKAPDVATFPYETPDDAPVIDKTVTVNGDTGSYPSQFWFSGAGSWLWRSTGLYAKAGSVVTVNFPANYTGESEIQIGAHSDKLWGKDNLKRSPQIVMRFKVDSPTMKVSNPWGGLLYIRFPKSSEQGLIDVEFLGVVEAPYYILGQTDNDEWNSTIRHRKAPWAELEAPGNLIWAVPTSSIQDMEDVSRIMTFWNDEMNVANVFAGFEGGIRERAERFSFDIHISAGWMHSGHPIGAYFSALSYLLDADKMYSDGTWGAFHELGHNQQWKSWTVGGKTTETGCNWWSLVMNEALGIYTDRGKGAKKFNHRIHDWVMKGKPFDYWSVWLALDTYVILAQEFGWDSYTNVIKMYYDMDQINDNDDKLDTWALLYSNEVGYNLCPYFKWFQWPLSNETLTNCSSLANWTSDPLAKYEHPTDHGDCNEGWLPYGDSCFYISTDEKTWFDAEEGCGAINDTHLASCMTEPEVAFLRSQTKDIRKGYHIGISDFLEPGVFVNLDGSEVDYLPWRGGNPDPNDHYHCGEFWRGETNDEKCYEKQRYICKQGPTACGPTESEESCPPDWRYFNDRCYFFGTKYVSFDVANETCTNTTGAFLVEIGSASEQVFLANTIKDMRSSGNVLSYYWQSFHIGMVDVGTNTENATWLSGEEALYTNWCEGEPGPSGNIRLHNYYGFCWSDTRGNEGYICELPANNPELP